jgi:predicted amidohydrolase
MGERQAGMANIVRVGLIQMRVVEFKQANLKAAADWIDECARQGAQIVALPEMFNCPYATRNFPRYAERQGGPGWHILSQAARRNKVTLVGGSMPEVDDGGEIYNTCYIFDRDGKQIGKHRKVHMFDIDVEGGRGLQVPEGGQRFKESETLSPGDHWTVVETEACKLGVSVCYDLRFPELARKMALDGAKVFIIPGAFNMTTGPAHWEILFRARAVDNQVFTLGCAPARDPNASYVSYGNSLVVSPWGEVTHRLGAEEGLLLADLDLDLVEKVRAELPLLKQRRTDLYT